MDSAFPLFLPVGQLLRSVVDVGMPLHDRIRQLFNTTIIRHLRTLEQNVLFYRAQPLEQIVTQVKELCMI